jgi:diguanylate cyclase (GGDEF)-like protein
MDVAAGRQFETMSQERHAVQRVCIALRELNSVLELEEVLKATIKVVRILVRADFISISLVHEGKHSIAIAQGENDDIVGRSFSLDEGLVGQAMKLRRPLPAKATCHGPMQVFGNDHKLSGYKSLLVLPLLRDEKAAVGGLTLASKEPGIFTRSRQEILELIAAQVAVKIDLGQAHEQINKMATMDGLTGLINHRTFQHGFDVMLTREERRSGCLCLILCDIDHFKKVNDTYGHPFGDKVLRRVSQVLAGTVRSVDLVARYGGEEFAIVLEDSDEKGGSMLAERIRHEVEMLSFAHNNEVVKVTISLGLASFPKQGTEKVDLISRADQALYQAKQQGRNRLVVWQAVVAA